MIAKYPLTLFESIYTSVSDQKRFFQAKFFFKKVLVMAFSIFCLRLVHQSSFTLVLFSSAVCVCLKSLGVIESFFCFLHLILFQKIPKHLLIIMHCILHFCIVLALDLLWSTSQDFIQESLHSSFEEKLCISRSSIPCFHGHNAFALIVRCAFYFMLRHNIISCMVISLF